MSLFSNKKDKSAQTPEVKEQKGEQVKGSQESVKENKKKQTDSFDSGISVLISPRITEKSAIKAEKGVYVFNVTPKATKSEISKEIRKRYSVNPVKVAVAKVPEKKILRRGVKGVKSGGKKAFVFLKEGEKIDIV